MKVVYADNNATSRVAREVFSAMQTFLKEHYGNPSSMHTFGGKIRKNINASREEIDCIIREMPPIIEIKGDIPV